jgi:23S rRNA pseudouridine1911/1915/1917 synthase
MEAPPRDFWTDTEAEEQQTETYTVPESAAGVRLDQFLPEVTDLSRAAAVRLLEGGAVTLLPLGGDRPIAPDKKTRLKPGDCLTVTFPAPVEGEILPENIPLDIVYEDGDILVVNKPSGMVVHPAPGNLSGTLVNALMYHCGDSLSGIGGVVRPGIVHRIDKDTSGLLVVAKHDAAHRALSDQLKTHTVSRIYYAVCVGNLREDSGTVNLPIGRSPKDRKKMAAFPAGYVGDGGRRVREAVTHYTVLERFPLGRRWGQSFTYLRCQLETGRTHQIRVHLSALGHPLLGDPLYGGDRIRQDPAWSGLLHGQVLHAGELRLIHPRTGENMVFTCDLPADFSRLLALLRQEAEQ